MSNPYLTETHRNQRLAELLDDFATLLNAMSRDEQRHAVGCVAELLSHAWGIAWGTGECHDRQPD